MLYSTVAGLRSAGKRATRRGNLAGGTVQTLLATLLDAGAGAVNQYTAASQGDPAGAAAAWWAQRQTSPPPPPPGPGAASPTCWEVLGLDPAGATPEKVRDVQRRLAAIYHSDTGGGKAGEAKLASVNAAASECQAEFKKRKK